MSLQVPDRFKAVPSDFIKMFGESFALALSAPDDPCENFVDEDCIQFYLDLAEDWICGNLANCTDSGRAAVVKSFKVHQLYVSRYLADPTKQSGVEQEAFERTAQWIKEQCCEECKHVDRELLEELGLPDRNQRSPLMDRECRIFTRHSQQPFRRDRLYYSAPRRGREKIVRNEKDCCDDKGTGKGVY